MNDAQRIFGEDLVYLLAKEQPIALIEAALKDENNPLAKQLLSAVQVSVDANSLEARKIVVAGLKRILKFRGPANGARNMS